VSDPLSTSRTARESLSRGLNALQADPSVPSHLVELAAPIAQAMGALHQLERTSQLLPHADVALNHVRGALAQLQAAGGAHPAVATAMEAVAQSLTLVHSLSRMANGQAQAAPAAASPATTQPTAAAAPPQAAAPAAASPATTQPTAAAAPPQAATPAGAPPAAAQPAAPAPQQQPAPQQPAPPAGLSGTAAMPPIAAKPSFPQQPVPPTAPTAPVGNAPPMVSRDPFAAPARDPFAAPAPGAPAAPAAPQVAPAPKPATPSMPVPAPPMVGNMQVINADLGAHSPTNFYKGLSGNDIIDHGGLFVQTYVPPKIGTPIRLKVSLPGGYEFEANAVVKWTREAGTDALPGFGAQFTEISPEARQLVYRYVRNREPLFHDDL